MDLGDVIALQTEISGKFQTGKAKEIQKKEEKTEIVTPLTNAAAALASQTVKA